MESGEVIISVQDLVNHVAYSRKKGEHKFSAEFLMRHGAKEDEMHVKALQSQIAQIEERLAPIERKLQAVDLLVIAPHRAKIEMLNEKMKGYPQAEIDKAMYEKQGAVYQLLRERGALTKRNYDNREDIARLTLLANSLSKEEGMAIKRMAEEEGEASLDLGGLDADTKMSLLVLLNRIGVPALLSDGRIEKSKNGHGYEGEVAREYSADKRVWLPKERLEEFDGNELDIVELNRKVQRLNAIKQVRELEGAEAEEFTKAQNDYVEVIGKRKQFLAESAKGVSQLKVRLQARIDDVMKEIEDERPKVSENKEIKQEVKDAVSEMLEGKKPAVEEKK